MTTATDAAGPRVDGGGGGAGDVQASRSVVGEADLREDDPLFMSDEFRMFCYKVLPCAKRFCHDWSICPFAHFSERAKRRDPRGVKYTAIACPEMKKGEECPRGDKCPYAHNVFEYWLHPTRYRTRMCRDGTSCARKVCFFAHKADELRVPPCRPSLPVADDPWPFGNEDPMASGTVDAAALKTNRSQSNHRRTFSLPPELLKGFQGQPTDQFQGVATPSRTYSIPPHMSQVLTSPLQGLSSGGITSTAVLENFLKSVGHGTTHSQQSVLNMNSSGISEEGLVRALLANLRLTSATEVQHGGPQAVNLQLMQYSSQAPPQYAVSSPALDCSQPLAVTQGFGNTGLVEASVRFPEIADGHPVEVMQGNGQNDEFVQNMTAPIQNAELLQSIAPNSPNSAAVSATGGDAVDELMRALMVLQSQQRNAITAGGGVSLSGSLPAFAPEIEVNRLESGGNGHPCNLGKAPLRGVLG